MKNRVSRLSIKTNMVMLIVLYVLMPLFVALIILSVMVQKNMSSNIRETYQMMFRQKADKIDNIIEIANYSSSAFITDDKNISLLRTIYEGGGAYERDRAQTQLARILEKTQVSVLAGFLGQIGILTRDGVFITSNGTQEVGIEYQKSDWYAGISQKGKFPYWDLEINSFMNQMMGERNTFAFGRIVQKYKDQNLGFWFVRIPQSVFWDDISEPVFRQGTMVMLSGDGRVLSEVRDEHHGSLAGSIVRNMGLNELRTDELVVNRDGRSTFYMATRLASNDAILLYIGDYGLIFDRVTKITHIMMVFMIVITIAITASILKVSTYITAPINNLVSHMQTIEQSDSGVIEGRGGFRETVELEKSFNRARERIHKLIEDVRLETEQKEKAYYESLQAQINPHFLFNTLNVIQWKAALNQDTEVSGMLSDLSVLLYETYDHGSELGTIAHSMVVLNAYVKIMKVRFSDQVSFFYTIQEGLEECLIPRFCLQPLVENSFLHGMTHMEDGLIVLRIEEVDGHIELTLVDNGKGMEKQDSDLLLLADQTTSKYKITGIGLSNIHQRVQALFGKEYGLEIDPSVEIGFRITLKIPKLIKGGADGQFEDTDHDR
ncbi:MAG: histidine kinase [Lacrimispora sp.]|uniref:sensor histidine kinase n=1 Tax=Lacrimispora sp. TaxID=2719234 RepID=UPI0039E5AD23